MKKLKLIIIFWIIGLVNVVYIGPDSYSLSISPKRNWRKKNKKPKENEVVKSLTTASYFQSDQVKNNRKKKPQILVTYWQNIFNKRQKKKKRKKSKDLLEKVLVSCKNEWKEINFNRVRDKYINVKKLLRMKVVGLTEKKIERKRERRKDKKKKKKRK